MAKKKRAQRLEDLPLFAAAEARSLAPAPPPPRWERIDDVLAVLRPYAAWPPAPANRGPAEVRAFHADRWGVQIATAVRGALRAQTEAKAVEAITKATWFVSWRLKLVGLDGETILREQARMRRAIVDKLEQHKAATGPTGGGSAA